MNCSLCCQPIRFAINLLLPFVVSVSISTGFSVGFMPGDVYWADGYVASRAPYKLINVTGGGDFGSASAFATIGRSPGQIVWSSDLATAYVTEFDNNRVVAISATGLVTPFATGISGPTGLLRTTDNRLLVVSYWNGVVLDVSSGGDFSGATAFASGFSGPRNLLQLANGHILLADQDRSRVFDITAGGSYANDTGFAFGLGVQDLVQDGTGHIYACSYYMKSVFDITAGGDFSAAAAFATGRAFIGLAVDGSGRLLASELGLNSIYNISSGGDFSSATPFARNLPGSGDTALDTVPVPEPSTAAALTLGVGLYAAGLRRRKARNID